MTIQTALRTCASKTGLYGRPRSWKGTASAIDLACRVQPNTQAQVIRSLGLSDAFLLAPWQVNPLDFLGDWETVTGEQLAAEVAKSE